MFIHNILRREIHLKGRITYLYCQIICVVFFPNIYSYSLTETKTSRVSLVEPQWVKTFLRFWVSFRSAVGLSFTSSVQWFWTWIWYVLKLWWPQWLLTAKSFSSGNWVFYSVVHTVIIPELNRQQHPLNLSYKNKTCLINTIHTWIIFMIPTYIHIMNAPSTYISMYIWYIYTMELMADCCLGGILKPQNEYDLLISFVLSYGRQNVSKGNMYSIFPK